MENRGAIVELGELFENTGTNMKFYTKRRNNAIPPFVHGERPNTIEPVYVSGGSGFVGPFRAAEHDSDSADVLAQAFYS